MQTLKLTRGHYLMVLLAMCGITASSIGILTNTAGVFFTAIAEDMHRDTAAINLTLTICNLTFAVAGMLSASVVNGKTFRPILIVCTAFLVGGTAALSFSNTLVQLYVFSAVRGFAGGMIGNVLATMVISRWFFSDAGFISSLALGCSGIAGIVFNPILEAIIRTAGWRKAYMVVAVLILLLNLPAILLPISLRPESAGLKPLFVETQKMHSNAVQEFRCKSPVILVFAICLVSFAAFVVALVQLFKSLAIAYGYPDTGIVMMTAALVVNTCGKFLMGTMTDKIGVRRSLLIYGTILSVGILLLFLVRNPVAMVAGASMMGLGYSIPTVGAVMLCRELFGIERYSNVFPWMNIGTTLANALGYPVLGFIYDVSGNYDSAVILGFVLIVLMIAVTIVVYRMAANEQTRRAGQA